MVRNEKINIKMRFFKNIKNKEDDEDITFGQTLLQTDWSKLKAKNTRKAITFRDSI